MKVQTTQKLTVHIYFNKRAYENSTRIEIFVFHLVGFNIYVGRFQTERLGNSWLWITLGGSAVINFCTAIRLEKGDKNI
jgi:uncharacterized membrane protein